MTWAELMLVHASYHYHQSMGYGLGSRPLHLSRYSQNYKIRGQGINRGKGWGGVRDPRAYVLHVMLFFVSFLSSLF